MMVNDKLLRFKLSDFFPGIESFSDSNTRVFKQNMFLSGGL